jgi:hypothetical protein
MRAHCSSDLTQHLNLSHKDKGILVSVIAYESISLIGNYFDAATTRIQIYRKFH